jgi:hypothetical protein
MFFLFNRLDYLKKLPIFDYMFTANLLKIAYNIPKKYQNIALKLPKRFPKNT